MVLGEQLENPYSVTNMKRALKSLQTSSISNAKVAGVSSAATEDMITTTHYYVKFKPKTEEELLLLKSDTLVNYFPYPLDYEIKEEGDEYRDPEVSADQPTYQYASVKVDHQLPNNINYEIIEELFIPDEDFDEIDEELIEEEVSYRNNLAKVQQVINIKDTDFWLTLVDESLKLTNNLEEEDTEVLNGAKTAGWFRSKWRPTGKITMDDDNLGNIGIEGLKIRATRWFTTHTGFTDRNGKFSCDGRFRGSARYRLDWERYHFALRDGGFSSAQKTGPSGRKKTWNWHITKDNSEQNYFATIFRAAYHYYYKDIKGLRRPKQNSFWKSKLRIGAFTSNKGKYGVHQASSGFGGLVTTIKIYTYGEKNVDTYATTIHELAHNSHYNMDKYNFNHTNTKVIESWARGVQWELTRMVYSNYLGRERSTGDYTLVVSDLIDDSLTERNSYGYGRYTTDGKIDEVEGYTIKQIEDALRNGRSFNQWRDNLINKYNNKTEQHVKKLFKAYE